MGAHAQGIATTRRRLRIVLGLALWLGAGVWGLSSIAGRPEPAELGRRVAAHLAGRPVRVEALFPATAPLTPGAPIRIEREGHLVQAGEVLRLEARGAETLALVAVYPEFSHLLDAEARLTSYRTRGNVEWILKTLLPPEVRDRIRSVIEARWQKERDRLFEELRPGLLRLGSELAETLRDELPRALDERQPELRVIGEVLREKAWERHLSRSFREDVWPQALERATPLLAAIGDDIVEAFPLWTLSWAYVVQKLPFTGEDRVRERLREFLDERAAPIVRAREDEMRALAFDILRDAAGSPETRQALEAAARDVVADPRFRESLGAVLESWIVGSERLRDLASGLHERPDLRGPLTAFLERLEPDVRTVANTLLLDRDGSGINPDLARVLRRQLLRENERWVLLEAGGVAGPPPTILRGLDGGIR